VTIADIVSRFIMELEECALENNIDACDECKDKENCTYRRDTLSAIHTLERLKPVTITEDLETWPDIKNEYVLIEDINGNKVTRQPSHVVAHLEDCKKHSKYIGRTWQYLPCW